MHAAINRSRSDISAYWRWKRTELSRPSAEFGEHVWHAAAATARTDRFDVRWRDGELGTPSNEEWRVNQMNERGGCNGKGLQEEAG